MGKSTEDGVQSTEDGGEAGAKVQIGRWPVQRWKGESTEYGVRRREAVSYEGRAKVQRWKGKMRRRRRVQSAGSSTEERQCKGANRPVAGAKVER